MKKRVCSIALALIFVFTIFPANVAHAYEDMYIDEYAYESEDAYEYEYAYIDEYLYEAPPAYSIVNVSIEGEPVEFDGQQAILIDGRVLVPVRGLFEMLDFQVYWDYEAREATISTLYVTIVIAEGSETFTVGGTSYNLDVPAQIINGSMMVPIRLTLESAGFYLGWEPATQTALISSSPLPEPEEVVRRPMVALTFDDGPAAHTERIVNTLEYHNARATFFVIGRRINARRDIVLRAHELGNEIANHLFHHQIMTVMTEAEILQDIRAGSAAIAAVTGESPPILRPPGGAVDSRVAGIAGREGYALIMWSIDTHDWRDRNVNTIYNRIMQNVRDGDIILLHDTHYTTARAMERVIPSLIAEGFYLVTVSELLRYAHGDGSPEPGRIYFNGW